MKQWTTANIAAALGVSESTIRAYNARGQMPPPTGRLARSPWWSSEDIEPWLSLRLHQPDQHDDEHHRGQDERQQQ